MGDVTTEFDIQGKTYTLQVGDGMGINREDQLLDLLSTFSTEFATNETFAQALKKHKKSQAFLRIIFNDDKCPDVRLGYLAEICFAFFQSETEWLGRVIRSIATNNLMVVKGWTPSMAMQTVAQLGVIISPESQTATSGTE